MVVGVPDDTVIVVALVIAVATVGVKIDVELNPLLTEAPVGAALLLKLLLLLLYKLLLDDAGLPLPLLAAIPLVKLIGKETGGNSGLTVFIDVPGVIGVAGVGCIQLCWTANRGSLETGL